MKTSETRFGRMTIVGENDGRRLSMKTYLMRFLYESFHTTWDTRLVLLPSGKPAPAYLAACSPVLSSEYGTARAPADYRGSEVEASALLYRHDFARATPLYFELLNDPPDAVVFVGLTFSTISLLSAARRRCCAIPLFTPGFHIYPETNPALRHAMGQCDYYLCHSLPERETVSKLVPGAQVRYLPLLAVEPLAPPAAPPRNSPSVLIFAHHPNRVATALARRLQSEGQVVELIVDSGSRRTADIPVRTMEQFISTIPDSFQNLSCAAILMERALPPVFYNLCQWGIPIFVPERLASLLNRDGVRPFHSPEEVRLLAEGHSQNCILEGYHHASLYNNYAVRYIQEWCLDNLQRTLRSRDSTGLVSVANR